MTKKSSEQLTNALPVSVCLMLHVADGDFVLFDGPPGECPPVPRLGDEIVYEHRRVRVEGVRHQYWAGRMQISLLA
jgi:hypothetical protein